MVFHRKQLINVGWFSSWQIRYALKEIEKGNIRYADRKPVIWHYGEAIIP
nr:MAG TPA: hypothetical protein [Caudoviricetes sp.]